MSEEYLEEGPIKFEATPKSARTAKQNSKEGYLASKEMKDVLNISKKENDEYKKK